MKFDYKKIENIRVEDIDHTDYPDYVDAFIDSADYNGEPMTDNQLNILNEDTDFVYECVINQIH